MSSIPLPGSTTPRIVILGAGFAGLRLASKLSDKAFQVLIIDKNNFHQFQPLFYQVASAGLAPSAIAFPVRKALHRFRNVHFRLAEVVGVDTTQKLVRTSIGDVHYDKLVIAMGADTNYFNMREIEQHALPMKSLQESLHLRNHILECMEKALMAETPELRRALMNVVVVGGGPTGTEVAGALAEMRKYVLPKDYPELDLSEMKIHLLEASDKLLNGMRPASSEKAGIFLRNMGVEVSLNTAVEGFDGRIVRLKGGAQLHSRILIWAAGVKGNPLQGIDPSLIRANGRLAVDAYHRVQGLKDVFALGDIAYMEEHDFPRGHPQVAQVAIQQANNLCKVLLREKKGLSLPAFAYKDLGSMATVGRNKAVVDLPALSFSGFFAWIFWLFVHLMAILGVKNKLFIFLEWMWSYLTFDQSLRLVIKGEKVSEGEKWE